jgi:RNA polymerase sigma-70 factor (ECF subfamily)
LSQTEYSEPQLIHDCQRGDSGAFRVLVEQYRSTLFGTAYLMVRDRQLAEEAVQNATLKMWEHIASLRDNGSVKPWMMRILVNEVNQQFRKKRVPTVPLEEAADVADDCDADELLIQNENHHLLKQALVMLPPDQKEAIVLRYFADMTIPEIASATSEREGTIKSRISRGLERMEKMLAEEYRHGERR